MNNLNTMKMIVLISIAFAFSACGSIALRAKDDTSVSQVKKVAVIGFESIEPMAKDQGLFAFVKGTASGKGADDLLSKTDPHVDAMYDDFTLALKRQMSWNVIEKNKMAENGTYKVSFSKTMDGPHMTNAPVPNGYRQTLAKDIMDQDAARRLTQSGRESLMEGLGVDALVVARISVSLSGNTFMGFGNHYPQAAVSFEVYGKGKEKPIWYDGYVEGEKAEESVGKTGFFDEKLLAQLAVKSAKTAFLKIGNTQVQ